MKLGLFSGALALATLQFGLAHAQDAAQTNISAVASDEIVVIGTGVRNTQTLTAEALQLEAPGASPIKLVDRLPGVAYSAGDAFGAYEWAVRINIRGFQQQQLGFTLDGIPLGDMSYGNYNGLHISRAVISENLDGVELSQGAGLLGTHSTNNLGGTLQYTTRGPSEEQAGVVAVSAGSEQLFRGYARFDTGALSELHDLRAYASIVHNEVDKWTNEGAQRVDQMNFGFAMPLAGGELSGYYNQSQRREADFQDMSLEMFDRLGYSWDNFAPNWTLAQQVADIANNIDNFNNATGAAGADGLSDITGLAPTNPSAGTTFPAPITSVDDAYYDASGLRDDNLARLSYSVEFSPGWNFSGTLYHHEQEGQGTWYTPYANPFAFGQGVAGVSSPISVRTTEYDMVRFGGWADLTIDLGAHELMGGIWLEHNSFDQARRFYANTRTKPRDVMSFMRNPFATQWAYDYEIDTRLLYLQDTWSVTDALTVLAGFKSVNVESSVVTIAQGFVTPVPGSDRDLHGSITSEDNFLPQVGLTYDLTDAVQVFGNYTENMRAFDLAPFNGQSQIAFDAVKRLTDPETSQTLEAGLRYRGDMFRGGLTGYYVMFDNRLLGIRQGAGIIGNPSIISNVGGVETKGVELYGEVRVNDDLSVFASYSYNDSTYEDNVVDATGAVLQQTAGATVVNTPSHLFKADVNYDNGVFFGGLSGSYIGDREQDYTNRTGTVDGHWTVDLNAGYRFQGALDGLEAQVNVTNLLDEEAVGTIGTNGFTSGNAYFNQSLIAMPPRQIFVTLRKTF